jgi:hypothetical protein
VAYRYFGAVFARSGCAVRQQRSTCLASTRILEFESAASVCRNAHQQAASQPSQQPVPAVPQNVAQTGAEGAAPAAGGGQNLKFESAASVCRKMPRPLLLRIEILPASDEVISTSDDDSSDDEEEDSSIEEEKLPPMTFMIKQQW